MQDCTLWQSIGLSFGSWGFGNVCNVGGASFFFFCGGGRKKQNKFPSNLHCLIKKLNPFFCYYLSLSYLTGCLSFYTCCQRTGLWPVRDLKGRTSQIAGEPNRLSSILCLKRLLKLPCNLHNSNRLSKVWRCCFFASVPTR